MSIKNEFQVYIKDDINKEYWNSLLIKSCEANLYQAKQWSDFFKEKFRSKPFFILVKKNRQIVAQLLIFETSYFYDFKLNGIYKILLPFKNLFKILTWSYGPIIHDKENFDKILNFILIKIDEIAKKEKAIMVKNSFTPILNTHDYSKIFKSHGYRSKKWGTFIIDLKRDLDDIWTNIKKETRKNIRRTKKKNVYIIRTKNLDETYEYCRILVEQKKRLGEKIEFEECVKWVETQLKYFYDNFNIFIAYYRNKAISGLITRDFNGIINEVGVAHSNFALKNKIYAQDMIKWEIIKWGHETGKRIYDLTGVNPYPKNKKERNIYRYKKKWGGKLIIYPIFSKSFFIRI